MLVLTFVFQGFEMHVDGWHSWFLKRPPKSWAPHPVHGERSGRYIQMPKDHLPIIGSRLTCRHSCPQITTYVVLGLECCFFCHKIVYMIQPDLLFCHCVWSLGTSHLPVWRDHVQHTRKVLPNHNVPIKRFFFLLTSSALNNLYTWFHDIIKMFQNVLVINHVFYC
jgi:hypothetical protein